MLVCCTTLGWSFKATILNNWFSEALKLLVCCDVNYNNAHELAHKGEGVKTHTLSIEYIHY